MSAFSPPSVKDCYCSNPRLGSTSCDAFVTQCMRRFRPLRCAVRMLRASTPTPLGQVNWSCSDPSLPIASPSGGPCSNRIFLKTLAVRHDEHVLRSEGRIQSEVSCVCVWHRSRTRDSELSCSPNTLVAKFVAATAPSDARWCLAISLLLALPCRPLHSAGRPMRRPCARPSPAGGGCQ